MKEINPDNIQRADILLVHTKYSPISWLIRKFTKSYWNHVGLFISKDDQWPKWVIEALGDGVVGRPFEIKYIKVMRDDDGNIVEVKQSKKYDIAIVRVKNITYEQRKQIATKAYQWALEERSYDYILLILGMILHLITYRKWRPAFMNAKYSFICSEVIATAYKKIANVDFGKDTAAGYITPADIGFSCDKNKDIEIIMSN